MHCFFIEPPSDGMAALPKDEAKHAARVLRLKPGDAVCAMDGAGGRWDAEIAAMDGSDVTLRLIRPLPDNESPLRLSVYQGVPKADKLDFIVQKLTELGAAALLPVKMARCVVRLDERDGEKRRERLARISAEAAKQCRRGRAMDIAPPLTWRQAIERMARHDLVLVPWEEAGGLRIARALAERPEALDIGIVIGPEGGMSAEEVGALTDAGAVAVTLGPRILRTETAAIAAATLAMGFRGDL